ncbi:MULTISPECIES: Scr1 family TA system antitoxin-like transcriptional regulator [unclassified Streptomyces]|uniref:Scr1 family TA system antitoxin-like transcriptional regulator n=1 Tax=unclassified Streptomyces TaxID=2593676 RepID=UPI0037FD0F27
MASRPAPTARRVRLGIELRKLRESARMTSTAAAQLLGTRPGQISNIETARFGVGSDRVRAMAHVYGCEDQSFVSALVDIAQERQRGWWEEYRGILPTGLLDLAEFEHHATGFRTAHTAHIPGLLQTTEHAREIYRQAVPEFNPPDVEHRVSHRVKRQAVLYRDAPAPYRAIIHEAALRMRFGGAAVARAQLGHLLALGEMEHVSIRVIPFDVGSYPGSGQTACYGQGPVPQLDTVQLDQAHGVAFLDAEAQLTQYRLLFERLDTVALGHAESRDFIHRIAKSL